MSKVTIDGKEYEVEKLSEQARQAIVSVQLAEQEIGRLKTQLGLAQTARAAYAKALSEALPKA